MTRTQLAQILNIKVHYLRYFVVLAEELHFGRAAERLAITQPPLSLAIKTLEDTLGVRLLDRNSKHVQLTPAGSAFRQDVVQVLDNIARAVQTARAVATGLEGRLDIGITGSTLYRELPRILAKFSQKMPGIEVTLREMASGEQIEALMHGQLHGGFINAASVPRQLEYIPLKDDRFVCCLPQRHKLAGAKAIKLEQLENEHFVMFSRDVAQDNHDNVIAILRRAGINPHTHHAARQWLTVIAMIANDMGVALVPASLARTGFNGVTFVPLKNESLSARAHAILAWNPSNVPAALQRFIECSETVLREASAPVR